ncbi:putative vacuolar (H+)-ATPase G subunit [Helianthus annuus]|nr:putative vacuolar (H+)-ATPase G subunit [Helianthus annuus]
MEADYQRKLTETSGDSGANVKRLEKETDAKIQHLKTEAERISGDVVGMLLKHVTTPPCGSSATVFFKSMSDSSLLQEWHLIVLHWLLVDLPNSGLFNFPAMEPINELGNQTK